MVLQAHIKILRELNSLGCTTLLQTLIQSVKILLEFTGLCSFRLVNKVFNLVKHVMSGDMRMMIAIALAAHAVAMGAFNVFGGWQQQLRLLCVFH